MGDAATSASAPSHAEGARAEAGLPSGGVLDELSSAFASARAALSHLLDLVSLEARRAGLTFVWMIAGGVVGAICFVGAWLGLMAALAMWAASLGVPPIAAVVAVATVNLAAAAIFFYVCFRISRNLLFSATRRQLAGECPVKPNSP
jgi:hypothetical protein